MKKDAIGIGSDHGGWALQQEIVDVLGENGCRFLDYSSRNPCRWTTRRCRPPRRRHRRGKAQARHPDLRDRSRHDDHRHRFAGVRATPATTLTRRG